MVLGVSSVLVVVNNLSGKLPRPASDLERAPCAGHWLGRLDQCSSHRVSGGHHSAIPCCSNRTYAFDLLASNAVWVFVDMNIHPPLAVPLHHFPSNPISQGPLLFSGRVYAVVSATVTVQTLFRHLPWQMIGHIWDIGTRMGKIFNNRPFFKKSTEAVRNWVCLQITSRQVYLVSFVPWNYGKT